MTNATMTVSYAALVGKQDDEVDTGPLFSAKTLDGSGLSVSTHYSHLEALSKHRFPCPQQSFLFSGMGMQIHGPHFETHCSVDYDIASSK